MRQSTVAFGRISNISPMRVDSDPEVHGFIELFRRLAAGGFLHFFKGRFSDSVNLDVESWLSVEFLGSLRWPTVVGCRGVVQK